MTFLRRLIAAAQPPPPRMRESLQQPRRRARLTTGETVLLIALLFFPTLALVRLAESWDARLVFGYAILLSATTYLLYWHDKRRAQSGGWRTPESTLHLVECLGGWPGAFLAQRTVRHKISKPSYQVTFWMIIGLHELVSFEFFHGFPYSRKLLAHWFG